MKRNKRPIRTIYPVPVRAPNVSPAPWTGGHIDSLRKRKGVTFDRVAMTLLAVLTAAALIVR